MEGNFNLGNSSSWEQRSSLWVRGTRAERQVRESVIPPLQARKQMGAPHWTALPVGFLWDGPGEAAAGTTVEHLPRPKTCTPALPAILLSQNRFSFDWRNQSVVTHSWLALIQASIGEGKAALGEGHHQHYVNKYIRLSHLWDPPARRQAELQACRRRRGQTSHPWKEPQLARVAVAPLLGFTCLFTALFWFTQVFLKSRG